MSDQNNNAMPYYRNYDDYKLDNPYHDDAPERDYDDEVDEARLRHLEDLEWEQYEMLKPKTNHDTNANNDKQD